MPYGARCDQELRRAGWGRGAAGPGERGTAPRLSKQRRTQADHLTGGLTYDVCVMVGRGLGDAAQLRRVRAKLESQHGRTGCGEIRSCSSHPQIALEVSLGRGVGDMFVRGRVRRSNSWPSRVMKRTSWRGRWVTRAQERVRGSTSPLQLTVDISARV